MARIKKARKRTPERDRSPTGAIPGAKIFDPRVNEPLPTSGNIPSTPEPPKPEPKPEPKPYVPSVIRSGETGAPTGVILPSGKQFGNLPPGHAQALIADFNEQQRGFAGSIEQTDFLAQQDLLAQEEAARAQIAGQAGLLDQQGQVAGADMGGQMGAQDESGIFGFSFAGLDSKQTFLSAISSPSTISKVGSFGIAAAWGLKGTAVGGPWGAVLGAAAGLAFGLYSESRRNIAVQKKDDMASYSKVLNDNKENLERVVTLINMDPANAGKYLESRQDFLNRIHGAHSDLKFDMQNNLNLALSEDGTRTMQEYTNFLSPGGRLELNEHRIRAALNNPNMDLALQSLLLSEDTLNGE